MNSYLKAKTDSYKQILFSGVPNGMAVRIFHLYFHRFNDDTILILPNILLPIELADDVAGMDSSVYHDPQR